MTRFPANESPRRTGLHSSLSVKFSFCTSLHLRSPVHVVPFQNSRKRRGTVIESRVMVGKRTEKLWRVPHRGQLGAFTLDRLLSTPPLAATKTGSYHQGQAKDLLPLNSGAPPYRKGRASDINHIKNKQHCADASSPCKRNTELVQSILSCALDGKHDGRILSKSYAI